MPTKDSQCRWCGEVFYGLPAGRKAPEHYLHTGKKCGGSGQKTGSHVG